MKYDYLIVGAGLYGAVFAQQKTEMGHKCLVIDRRDHIAGNIYSKMIEGIDVHMYGPHIFHTDKEDVWMYVNRFTTFNHFTYSPIANYKGELYNLPFNMNTFTKMWPDVHTPLEAQERIRRQRETYILGLRSANATGVASDSPNIDPDEARNAIESFEAENLEQQAISLVGRDIYEKLIKGYTEKQWGRPCSELPAFIIKRLPVRLTFDNNYFNHPHQGIPVEGYTKMIERMLEGIEVRLNTDYLQNKDELASKAESIIYTGPIDEYYGYEYGPLEYRSLRFETETLDMPNFQGVAGMNYTDSDHPYTRIIEHKHFLFGAGNPDKTVITKEYSATWKQGDEPYYPVNNDENSALYDKYKALADKEDKVRFGGRLGTYRYMDMDQVIAQAIKDASEK